MSCEPRGWVWFVLGGVFTLGMVWLLCGCATSLMERTPVSRSTVLTIPPTAAFSRAATTFTRMGGHVQMYDAQNRRLSGLVHGAVVLTVTVDNQSIVEVTGVLVPGKVVLGSMTEVEDYVALLTQEGR